MCLVWSMGAISVCLALELDSQLPCRDGCAGLQSPPCLCEAPSQPNPPLHPTPLRVSTNLHQPNHWPNACPWMEVDQRGNMQDATSPDRQKYFTKHVHPNPRSDVACVLGYPSPHRALHLHMDGPCLKHMQPPLFKGYQGATLPHIATCHGLGKWQGFSIMILRGFGGRGFGGSGPLAH